MKGLSSKNKKVSLTGKARMLISRVSDGDVLKSSSSKINIDIEKSKEFRDEYK